MKFMLLLLAFLGYVALSKSSLNELPVYPGVGGFYKGPNSETIIKGPDGSVITAQQEGGSIVTQGLSQPIVVADIVDEPVQPIEPLISAVSVSPSTIAPPIIASPAGPVLAAAPVITVTPASIETPIELGVPLVAAGPAVPMGHTVEIIQPDTHIIETEIVDAPVIEPQQSSDLVGPSGSISTRGSSSIVSGPASTTISEPARVILATPLVAAVPIVSTVTTPLRAIPVIPDLVNQAVSRIPIPSVATYPGISVSTPLPPVAISTTENQGIPIPVSTLAPPTNLFSTTIAPPTAWTLNNVANGGFSLSTPAPNIGALIEPASTYGVVNAPDREIQVSSTPRSDTLLSSTLAPIDRTGQSVGITSTLSATDLGHVNNRQLYINPSLIPSANIIPPEIGPLPPGAIDLGSTITVSTTPRSPELTSATESPNIQRISSENSILSTNARPIDFQVLPQPDGRIDPLVTNQISTQNIVQLTSPGPLLASGNTIPEGIPNYGLIGPQLANYGIDSSQIGLDNVPLSLVSRIPQTIDQEIDQVSAQLWNRYARDVKEKKVKEKKVKDKE